MLADSSGGDIGDTPGLNLDAINPDDLAVQWLFPGNHTPIAWLAAPPFLAQVYHGVPSALFMALSILITGTTSMIQHHIVSACVVWAIIVCIYIIMRSFGGKQWVCGIAAAFIATSPTVLTMFCTPYYVELFGCFVSSIGAIFAIRWYVSLKAGNPRFAFLWWAYGLLGVAFYSYFNYIFFLPALVLIHVAMMFSAKRGEASILRSLFRGIIGFALGCSLYFISFTQIWARSAHPTHQTMVVWGFAGVFFVLLLLADLLCRRAGMKNCW